MPRLGGAVAGRNGSLGESFGTATIVFGLPRLEAHQEQPMMTAM